MISQPNFCFRQRASRFGSDALGGASLILIVVSKYD